jgi:hypothetical protein
MDDPPASGGKWPIMPPVQRAAIIRTPQWSITSRIIDERRDEFLSFIPLSLLSDAAR